MQSLSNLGGELISKVTILGWLSSPFALIFVRRARSASIPVMRTTRGLLQRPSKKEAFPGSNVEKLACQC